MTPLAMPIAPKEEPQPVGRRLALLICNGNFPNIPDYRLFGPAKDGERLNIILSEPETCGFTVCTLIDKGLLEVRREIARICAEAGNRDTLLIYYSGNGLLGDNGSLYLLVADSERDYLLATALDAEFILSQLRGSRCRQTVLLIDGCHAGAFFANNRGIPNGLYAITSCGAQEMCSDTPEGGAFTLALCAGLRNAAADIDGDGRVFIDELHEFTKQKLLNDGRPGIPQKWVWNVPEPIYISSMPPHIFLSYAREDITAAKALSKALQAEGFSVWVDQEGIQSGNWKERVIESLNRARAVVMLLTSHSLASTAVRNELAFATTKQVPIVPVQMDDIHEDSLPDWFILDYGELHRQSFAPKSPEEAVKELAVVLRRLRSPQKLSFGLHK